MDIGITVECLFKAVISVVVCCALLKLDIVATFIFQDDETLIPSGTLLVSGVYTKKTWGVMELFSLEENFELTFLRNRNKNLISEKMQ